MRDKQTRPLWQIDAAIEGVLESLCDEDGVIDEEGEKRLADLDMEREKKLEGCALFIKNRLAMAKAIREEEKALAERRRQYEADAERVEGVLSRSLNGERFETGKVCVSWRTSQAVEINEGAVLDWDDDQASRFVRWSYTISKDEVKKALKEGEEIAGARLVTRQNMGVK